MAALTDMWVPPLSDWEFSALCYDPKISATCPSSLGRNLFPLIPLPDFRVKMTSRCAIFFAYPAWSSSRQRRDTLAAPIAADREVAQSGFWDAEHTPSFGNFDPQWARRRRSWPPEPCRLFRPKLAGVSYFLRFRY